VRIWSCASTGKFGSVQSPRIVRVLSSGAQVTLLRRRDAGRERGGVDGLTECASGGLVARKPRPVRQPVAVPHRDRDDAREELLVPLLGPVGRACGSNGAKR